MLLVAGCVMIEGKNDKSKDKDDCSDSGSDESDVGVTAAVNCKTPYCR